eukprot:TRINITY_DN6249_c0_g1_i1.p1 TRINITY_DN6249_c0_g1~~TRINITY_DN6249_c0_g1_i1.p1  ORF type:complete len:369 (-),score=105.00 TRINITY_DN6249_c0_g1_i1:19-1080(-)
MARTQKNKATEYHLGLLKAKVARYRQQLMDGDKAKSGGKGEGFDVMKSGDARVCLIGFPSVGKSTLLSSVTETKSSTGAYEFTTLTCIPGIINHKGSKIQLLDLPGIIEGASQGKGRGRQVIAVARTSDMVIMMLDAAKGERQKELLTKELEDVGIRLNKSPPNIYFKRKDGGGVSINSTLPLTKIDERMIKLILHDYKIHNCEVLFREDCTVDDLIDVIEGNVIYLKCLYVWNKCDTITIEDVDSIAHTEHSVVISCQWNLGLDFLIEKMWEYLELVRVYTKRRGEPPDLEDCITVRKGATVEHICHSIHRDLAMKFNYALVWGVSAKHQPQRVGITHVLEDEDVVQIMIRV